MIWIFYVQISKHIKKKLELLGIELEMNQVYFRILVEAAKNGNGEFLKSQKLSLRYVYKLLHYVEFSELVILKLWPQLHDIHCRYYEPEDEIYGEYSIWAQNFRSWKTYFNKL